MTRTKVFAFLLIADSMLAVAQPPDTTQQDPETIQPVPRLRAGATGVSSYGSAVVGSGYLLHVGTPAWTLTLVVPSSYCMT